MKQFRILTIISTVMLALVIYGVISQHRRVREYFSDSCESVFPRRIFQTWKSRTEFPENFAYWSNTWKSLNPSYKYEIFDDNDIEKFITEKFPWFLPRFNKYNVPIKKADAVRYFYLYAYGGIYADMDFECLKNFDALLTKHKDVGVLLGCMADAEDHATTSPNNIPNALMISKPRHDLWICVFHVLEERRDDTGLRVEDVTGPVVLKEGYFLYKKGDYKNTDWYKRIVSELSPDLKPCNSGDAIVLPSQTLYPISWERREMKALNDEMLNSKNRAESTKKMMKEFPDSYAATYWTHTWE